jgi:LacI family transcriptional regulator
VSISTVSKSLRNSPEIGEDTRLKVQAFAKFYNYRPNNIVPKFKEQKDQGHRNNYTEIVHHFFSTIINGIEQVANENGYSVIICLSDDSLIRKFLTWKC